VRFLLHITPILASLLTGAAAEVRGAEYGVATANDEATNAGMQVLSAGGSAADAAVAIQMVLGVVEPQSSGLGGGAIALYWAARERRMTAFDGLARAPSSYDPESADLARFSHSGAAVGVPGSLRMLEVMHRRYGKLAWNTLFGRAIELADKGFTVSSYIARSLGAAARAGISVPAWLADSSGKPLTEGAGARNPALADTLRMVAKDGADALYVTLADQIVSATQHTSPAGRMTIDDLAHYTAIERQPLCLPSRQNVVCSFPPPSYGGVAVLEMLGILERRKLPQGSFVNLDFVHRFLEAGRLAEADSMASVGDTGAVTARRLLDPVYLQTQAGRIRDRSALVEPAQDCAKDEHGPEPSTSQISIVDAQGDALAMTTTININFGSWITVGGFFLNDAMTNFARPGSGGCTANAPAGNKRAATSMAPVIATGATGSVVLVGGSAGAGEIVDYVAQAVLELLANRPPAEALDEGHVSSARAAYPETMGLVELERGRAVAQLAGPLALLGHKVIVAPLQSGTAFIVRRSGHLEGAADPRRDGTYATSR
jgi:gamma-glutamyltranspeptidase/glutathione hydrolase